MQSAKDRNCRDGRRPVKGGGNPAHPYPMKDESCVWRIADLCRKSVILHTQVAETGFAAVLRREYLDWIIPLSEGHLRKILTSWMAHYNQGRPHSSLGPGIPYPRLGDPQVKPCGHQLPVGHHVVATPVLGGLHHEYSVQRLGVTLPKNPPNNFAEHNPSEGSRFRRWTAIPAMREAI
jgi:hypothetical protein